MHERNQRPLTHPASPPRETRLSFFPRRLLRPPRGPAGPLVAAVLALAALAVCPGLVLASGGAGEVGAATHDWLSTPATPVEEARVPGAEVGSAPTEGVSGRLDLQVATAEELCRLPGIGRARAEAILRFREQRALRRVRDLRRIHGIGPRLIRRIEPLVMVSPPPPVGR